MPLPLPELAGFLASFAVILVAAELFTNSIEWLGKRLGVSQTAIGSVFAAVGTALPETLIPFIAILLVGRACAPGQPCAGHEVGTGAILGAPFLLSTAAMLVSAIAVLAFRQRRGGALQLRVDAAHGRRDLGFFLPAYAAAIGAAFLPSALAWAKPALALGLIAMYGVYLWKVFREEAGDHDVPEKLFFGFLGRHGPDPAQPSTLAIAVQLAVSLAGIVGGAQLFVDELQSLAAVTGFASPLVLSLILSPLATELPEKFNSVIWIRDRKDTLAFGNISGAMVFQSCFPVAIGLAFTAWDFRDLGAFKLELLSAGLALCSAAVMYWALGRGRLPLWVMGLTGSFYGVFLAGVLAWG